MIQGETKSCLAATYLWWTTKEYNYLAGWPKLWPLNPVVCFVTQSPASLALLDQKILTAIYRAVDWINDELPKDRQLIKAPETRLLGPQSVLDSMHLVSLIVTTEREIEDAFGAALTLADERALSMKASPFRSIQSLADYVALLMRDDSDG